MSNVGILRKIWLVFWLNFDPPIKMDKSLDPPESSALDLINQLNSVSIDLSKKGHFLYMYKCKNKTPENINL